MKRLIFVLIFISFSSNAFPQWLVDGGNLIWPYGDISIPSGNIILTDTLVFNSFAYPSRIYSNGFEDEGDYSGTLVLSGNFNGTKTPLLLIDGTGMIWGKSSTTTFFTHSLAAHKFYGSNYNTYFGIAFPNSRTQVTLKNSSSEFVVITVGSNSPETVIASPIGSIYLRTDGVTDSTFYIKESGTGTTGWIPK